MHRSIHARPGLGAALQIVQEGGGVLRRVVVDAPALILVRRGRKRVRCGSAVAEAQPGEMIAFAPGSEVEVTNTPSPSGPYEALCLAFDLALGPDAAAVRNGVRRLASIAALGRPPAYLLAAFERAAASCGQDNAVPDDILRHQFAEVLLALDLVGWRFDLRGAQRVSVQMRRLLASDPAHPWRMGEVGRSLGMSEPTLRRRLAAEGVGFRTIIAQVRMGHALALLQSSDLSITQIAYAAGYESLSQFSAKFRRHFGQSPAHLRRDGARA